MTTVGGYHDQLAAARTEIDRLDQEITALLVDRLRVSAQIGRIRKSMGTAEVGGHHRGGEVLARYRQAQVALDEAGLITLEPIGLAVLEHSAQLQRRILGVTQ
ncbi:chorismate mutase [Streptomyces sp. NPDC005799]|uniref:chorismate mutase n=1 Tax=Streptomyces sp. NPDC005799 TaxID=3154678 RepID=UPI0034045203